VRRRFDDADLDPDAVKVLRRLGQHGYQAFLVGGCVRDLLLGRKPKDFDIVTSALPGENRHLFRNCRLIGRRFRLAHMLFSGGKIIEVATFRRGATDEDRLQDRHASENLFGGPADDAVRRDFPMNALMYDVVRGEIHDYVGGLEDIERRRLSTIGDPERRLPEDPVRVLRAAKFAVLCDLEIDPALRASMARHAPLITTCAPARLVEELLKILRTGQAGPCLHNLHQVGLLEHLLPKVDGLLRQGRPWQEALSSLAAFDERLKAGLPTSEVLMLCALLEPFVAPLLEEEGDLPALLGQAIDEATAPMRFTKRHLAAVRQVWALQRRLATGPASRRSRKLREREGFEEALALFELRATPEQHSALRAWQRMLYHREAQPAGETAEAPRPRRRRSKKRVEPKPEESGAPRI
jgi:poly(A) polymerase